MSNETKKERPQEVLETKNGYKVTFNKWITVREFDELTAIFTKANFATSVDAKNEKADLKSEDTAALIEAAEKSKVKAVELCVTSITPPDGEAVTKKFYDFLQDMPSEDGGEIFEAIEYITNPKKKPGTESPFSDTQPTEESKATS